MTFGSKSVSVSLRANVSDYIGKITAAQRATKDFGKASLDSANKNKAAWTNVGKAGLVAGGALAAGVLLAVKAFSDFDKEMSNVKAVSGATAGEMGKLQAAAIKAGADTKFSAAEAAKAEAELAKVGIVTADILGGALLGSLNLAAAGNLDLGEAASISGKAMKIFSLAGEDVGHIADVLASGANKSAADVSDLGQALAQGGLIAAQTGLTLESTVGVLSAFADNALMAADSGTSLKTFLMRLNPTTDEAATLMDQLGLRAYDAQGSFVGMSEYAGKLKTGLAGMTDEQRNATLATLFGSDAVRAANILYKIGAEGVDSYTKAVNDNGAAARMAAVQMDNLAGDLDQLKGSLETALIQAGSGGNDALRSLAQNATDAVNAFGDLPAPVQQSALGLAATAAAGLLVVGAVGTLYPKLQETKKALEAVGVTGDRASRAMGGLGKAAVALAVAVTAAKALQGAMSDVVPGVEATRAALLKTGDATANLDSLFKSIDANGMDWVPDSIKIDTLAKAFERVANKTWAENISDTTDAMIGLDNAGTRSAEVFTKIGKGLGTLVTTGHADLAGRQFDAMAASLGLTKEQLPELLRLMPAYGEAVQGVANQSVLATGKVGDFAGELTGLAPTAEDAANALKDLLDGIEGFGSKTLDSRGAARDYQAAIDAGTGSLKEFRDALIKDHLAKHKSKAAAAAFADAQIKAGKALDIGTDSGRKNAQALEGIATSSLKSITANYQNGTSVKALDKQVADSRKTFVNQATAMGLSKTAAGKLADELGLTKYNVDTLNQAKADPKITADTTKANREVDRLNAKLMAMDGLTVTPTISVGRVGVGNNDGEGKGSGTTFATGGLVTGPGTGTSDSIPAWVSTGEYWIKAAAVQKYGKSFFDEVNSMRFASGGIVNAGGSTSTHTETNDGRMYVDKIIGPTMQDVEAQMDRKRRMSALGSH